MYSYAKLQRLTEATRPELAMTFHRVAEILTKTRKGKPLDLNFLILDDDTGEPIPWSVAIGKDGGTATEGRSERPDVEIITRAETWWQIADGRLSPLEAFVMGKLRVRGNLERAKRVFLIDLAAEGAQLPDWLR